MLAVVGVAGTNSGNKNINNLVWGRVTNYKDIYEVGAANWCYVLYDEERKGSFTIELQAELTAQEPALGEFPISSTLAVGTAVAGTLDEEYLTYGTIWRLVDGDRDAELEHVFLKSGTVTLGKSGDNYTINVNALDGHGNTVTMSYTGALEKRE